MKKKNLINALFLGLTVAIIGAIAPNEASADFDESLEFRIQEAKSRAQKQDNLSKTFDGVSVVGWNCTIEKVVTLNGLCELKIKDRSNTISTYVASPGVAAIFSMDVDFSTDNLSITVFNNNEIIKIEDGDGVKISSKIVY